MGSALVNPQERSRQNSSHFLPSLQSLSGLQPGPDESEGLSQLQRTTGPTLEIPSGSGWLWERGQVKRPASRAAFLSESPAWRMAQRQEISERGTGSGSTEGMKKRCGKQSRNVRAHCQELRLALEYQQGLAPLPCNSPTRLAQADGVAGGFQQWGQQPDPGEWETWERRNRSHQTAAGYQGHSEESILSLWVFQIFTL